RRRLRRQDPRPEHLWRRIRLINGASPEKQALNSLVGKGGRAYLHPRRLAAAFERQHIPSTVHFLSGAGSGGGRGPHHLAPTWLAGSNGNENARTAHVAPPPYPFFGVSMRAWSAA